MILVPVPIYGLWRGKATFRQSGVQTAEKDLRGLARLPEKRIGARQIRMTQISAMTADMPRSR